MKAEISYGVRISRPTLSRPAGTVGPRRELGDDIALFQAAERLGCQSGWAYTETVGPALGWTPYS